jgi:hypothetical protein
MGIEFYKKRWSYWPPFLLILKYEDRSKSQRYYQGRGISDVDDIPYANGYPHQNL